MSSGGARAKVVPGTDVTKAKADSMKDVNLDDGGTKKANVDENSNQPYMGGLQTYQHEGDYEMPPMIPKEDFGYGSGKCGLQEIKIGSCGSKGRGLCRPIVLNPLSAFLGFGTLLGFAIWCIVDPVNSKATLGTWQSYCTEYFTWFYIASQDVWIIFLGFVYYYYGNIRLGKQTDRPEFDNATYFAMLFSSGVAVGLFVFGTAEPLYHYDYWLKNRYNGGDINENDRANYAILLTIYHWGFHGWCVYTLVGLQMGLMVYRKHLPMTMRTCFYPLLGKWTWGWIGSFIDGFSIVTIVAGVCTSLGLGALQIRRGLEGMNAVDSATCIDNCPDDILLAIIWGITAIATISVISGLYVGIKSMSQLAFGLGMFILTTVFLLGSTAFYLNNMTQSVGYYLQYFMTQLGWHTDAFAQLRHGEGASPDDKGASKADQAYGGAPSFMDGWTIFYWGWWIAWSPFVGMFVARISRGRTIREVINYSLTGPLLFAIMWFGVFGGAAIQMEHNAQSLWTAGVDLYNDPSYFQAGQGMNPIGNFHGPNSKNPVTVRARSSAKGFGSKCGVKYTWTTLNGTTPGTMSAASTAKFCHQAGSGMMNVDGCIPRTAMPSADANGFLATGAGSFGTDCGACFVQQAAFGNATYTTDDAGKKVKATGLTGCELFTLNPANAGRSCPFYIKSWRADPTLSPQCLFTDWDQESSWYNVVGQFASLGEFLQGLSIITLVFYFVTSSDSGSLVVDTISANGRDEQNPMQRVLWALIEGLVATGLVVGGRDSEDASSKQVLKALQSASICCGLVFTFLLCFMMPALWAGLKNDELTTTIKKRPRTFATPIYGGIFDVNECIATLGKCPFPAAKVFSDWAIAVLAPAYAMYQLVSSFGQAGQPIQACGSEKLAAMSHAFATMFCWLTWLVCMCLSGTKGFEGIWAVGWTMFAAHAALLAITRSKVRNVCGLSGNFAEDFWASLVLYPSVYNQCQEEMDKLVVQRDSKSPSAKQEETKTV